jgi:hypothetical protein
MSSSQYQNGRVIMNNTQNVKDMNMIEGNKPNNNFQVESLYGIQETSKLNQLFFSKKNMDIIQNNIRYTVYVKTNKKHIIDKQSDIELQIIMRSMYLQYSKNLDINISKQIEELNNHVLNYCITSVYNEAVAYLKYKEDASSMHKPMQHPIYSNKTNKTLEQKFGF